MLIADDALIDDYLYVGAIDEFERVNFDVGIAGTGTYLLGWEYYNGATWVAIPTPSDTTNSFRNVGNGKLTFTAPGNWATTTIAFDTPSAGSIVDMYWIRASVFANTMTIQPFGNTISVAGGNTVKYLPFQTTGIIEPSTGLTVTAVWLPDVIAS
jgi:hypothetical protein